MWFIPHSSAVDGAHTCITLKHAKDAARKMGSGFPHQSRLCCATRPQQFDASIDSVKAVPRRRPLPAIGEPWHTPRHTGSRSKYVAVLPPRVRLQSQAVSVADEPDPDAPVACVRVDGSLGRQQSCNLPAHVLGSGLSRLSKFWPQYVSGDLSSAVSQSGSRPTERHGTHLPKSSMLRTLDRRSCRVCPESGSPWHGNPP